MSAAIQEMTFTTEVIIRLAVGVAGLAVLWKTFFVPLKRIYGRIEDIQRQFYPNGGGSLRDVVDGGLLDVIEIKRDQQVIISKVTGLEVHRMIEMERSDIASMKFGADLGLVEANPAAQRLLGCDLETLRGHGWKNCVHPDYVDRLTTSMQAGAEEKRRVHADVIIKRTRTNGVHAAISFIPIVCERQNFFGFEAIATPMSPEI